MKFERGESVLVPYRHEKYGELHHHGVVIGPGPLKNTSYVTVWNPPGTHYYPNSCLKEFPLEQNPSWQHAEREYRAEIAIVEGHTRKEAMDPWVDQMVHESREGYGE